MRSAGENRLDRPAQRLWNTLRIAFAQSKMFKDGRAGWMHAFIFWGFLVLLFRAFEFFLIGFWPIFEGPYSVNFRLLDMEGGLALDVISVIYAIYFYAKDVFILLVILACLYALYRRLVVKPKRLNLSNEGIIILLLILTIMVSDVVFEGAQISPSTGVGETPLHWVLWEVGFYHPDIMRSCDEPFGYRVCHTFASGRLFDTAFPGTCGLLDTHCLILIFLVILPRSKHFHIITSIPNVFLGNVTQTGNQLSRIDFEDESKETFGVTRIEEFSWKKLLDLHTCTECGRCDVFCPALNSDKPLSPKQFTIDLRDHLNSQTPALLNNKEAR